MLNFRIIRYGQKERIYIGSHNITEYSINLENI